MIACAPSGNREHGRKAWRFAVSVVLLASGCSHLSKNAETVASDRMATESTLPSSAGDPSVSPNAASQAEYHFSMAQAYVNEGNIDRAIEEYRVTLMYDPTSPLVHARLASEYVKKGMLSEALDSCREALRLDPEYVDARLMLAGLYSASREPERAVVEYDRVLKKNRSHEEANIYKAQVLLEAGKPLEAVAALKKYVNIEPESPIGWYYLARAEQRADHFKEAVDAFKKSLQLKSSFNQAALALGFLYEEKGKVPEAIKVYENLFSETQDMAAANRLSTLLLKQEKYAEAVQYLRAIQSTDPEDFNARVKLGLVQMELKKYPEAIETFREILKKNPESDRIHYYLGSIYEETKQTDLAIEALSRVPADSRLFPDAALHAAYLKKQAGNAAEAKSFIGQAIEKSPRVAAFHLFAASLEEEAGNVAEGVKILEKALGTFPDDEKIRFYLGSLYDRQGQVEKSLAQMESILQINPDNADALNYLGYTWTLQGVRLGDAERVLKRAMALRPGNGFIMDSWGWYLFTTGKVKEAVVALEKAAHLKPDESTILEHLADAYLKAQLHEKAVHQYRQAVKVAQEAEARQKLEQKLDQLKQEMIRLGRKVPEDTSSGRLPASPSEE